MTYTTFPLSGPVVDTPPPSDTMLAHWSTRGLTVSSVTRLWKSQTQESEWYLALSEPADLSQVPYPRERLSISHVNRSAPTSKSIDRCSLQAFGPDITTVDMAQPGPGYPQPVVLSSRRTGFYTKLFNKWFWLHLYLTKLKVTNKKTVEAVYDPSRTVRPVFDQSQAVASLERSVSKRVRSVPVTRNCSTRHCSFIYLGK